MDQKKSALSFDFNVNNLIFMGEKKVQNDLCITGAPPCFTPPREKGAKLKSPAKIGKE